MFPTVAPNIPSLNYEHNDGKKAIDGGRIHTFLRPASHFDAAITHVQIHIQTWDADSFLHIRATGLVI